MGDIYTFTPKFPQANCHLCGNHYKNIFAHIRGKEHKTRFNEYQKRLSKIKDDPNTPSEIDLQYYLDQ